ncbi:MAG: type I-E CRISPR-associated protein Cas6/Cse3/CasE [Chlorobium sp.]|nr:type I-E CRISPR-associated protein Cas6/Cse3/CasE [Chlorobium sp.]
MYAAVLRLSRSDIKALRITDAYSVHRVVYDLFADARDEAQKQTSQASGILYADKGGDFHHRQILLLADRLPNLAPPFGTVDYKPIAPQFLEHQRYAFEVVVNPTRRDSQSGKLVAVRGREAIADWFVGRATTSWGFRVERERLQVDQIMVQRFAKGDHTVTHGSAALKGALEVLDQDRFKESFRRGIGRGRAFGFGLLQIVPL